MKLDVDTINPYNDGVYIHVRSETKVERHSKLPPHILTIIHYHIHINFIIYTLYSSYNFYLCVSFKNPLNYKITKNSEPQQFKKSSVLQQF